MMSWLRFRQDIPLDRDVTGRALPWILGVLAFLAVLVLAGALFVQQMMSRWESGIEGSLSVQIMPVEGETDKSDGRVQAMLDMLKTSPLVERAALVSESEMQKLLSPWLGEGQLPDELPVPRLIDIQLKPEVQDISQLREDIAKIPGTNLDEHAKSFKEVQKIAQLVLLVAYSIVTLICFSAVLIVWMLVRTGLAVHRETIELLHLVGATDGYVARQFHLHVTRLALEGIWAGAILAVGILALFHYYGQGLSLGLAAPEVDMGRMIVLLAIVPATGVVLSSLTARHVALSLLRRLP